jgi:hypothetical protein
VLAAAQDAAFRGHSAASGSGDPGDTVALDTRSVERFFATSKALELDESARVS